MGGICQFFLLSKKITNDIIGKKQEREVTDELAETD